MLKSSQPILQCLLYLDICMFHLCFTNKNLKLFMLLQSSYLACLFSLVEKKPAKSFNRELSYFFLVLVFQELPSLADLFDKNMFKVITLNEYIFLDKNKKNIKCILMIFVLLNLIDLVVCMKTITIFSYTGHIVRLLANSLLY